MGSPDVTKELSARSDIEETIQGKRGGECCRGFDLPDNA
jgi:hypothetical protein